MMNEVLSVGPRLESVFRLVSLGVPFCLPPKFLPLVLAFPSGGGQGEKIGHQSFFLQGIAESQEFIDVLENEFEKWPVRGTKKPRSGGAF